MSHRRRVAVLTALALLLAAALALNLRGAESAPGAARESETNRATTLAQHHRELAGMSAVEEEGLWLLADCAQHRRADDVERVRSFYEEHTDSTVRRRLRRACLEPAETH